MKKKVACFFTCGYTERDAMLTFLQKVRPDAEYEQFCPNRTPRSRRPEMISPNLNGLTGQRLLDYVYAYLSDNEDAMSGYDAVLIEDDLDDKFSHEEIPGKASSRVHARTPEFCDHCGEVKSEVQRILGKDKTFPVILLYASPEIEAWFIADWQHTFGKVYGPDVMNILNAEENQYFSDCFEPTVQRDVLTPRYKGENIEHYGFFKGKYKKLSADLIQCLEKFKIHLCNSVKTRKAELANAIGENPKLRYSKARHGEKMLNHLDPSTVYGNCPHYFQRAVDELRQL